MENRESFGKVLNNDWPAVSQENFHLKNDLNVEEKEVREFPVILRVLGVVAGSACEKAGIKNGDIVTMVYLNEGQSVVPDENISDLLQSSSEGIELELIDIELKKRRVKIIPQWNEQSQRWTMGLKCIKEIFIGDFFDEQFKDLKIELNYTLRDRGEPVKGYVTLGEVNHDRKNQPDKEKRREIIKFILFVPDSDGKFVEYDLIKRWNQCNVPVFWSPSMERSSGVYEINSASVVLKELDPHILAHEFRHSFQFNTGMFDSIKKYYRSATADTYNDLGKYVETVSLDDVKAIILFLFKDVDEETKVEIEKFIERELEDFVRECRSSYMFSDRKKWDLGRSKQELEMTKSKRFLKQLEDVKPLLAEELDELSYKVNAVSGGLRECLKEIGASYDGVLIDENTSENLLEQIFEYIVYCKESLNRKKFSEKALYQGVRVDVVSSVLIFEWVVGSDKKKISIRVPLEKEKLEKIKAQVENPQSFVNLEREITAIEKVIQSQTIDFEESQKRFEEKVKKEVFPGVTLVDILRIPTVLLERDAEYGGLLALRSLKKETGLDFSRLTLPTEAPNEGSQMSERTPLQKVRQKVSHLLRIESYMNQIGVPTGCVRNVKKAVKSKLHKDE